MFLHGEAMSQHTLKIFSRLFGADAIRYYDVDPVSREDIELPISTAEAILSLEQAESLENNLEDRQIGFSVFIDLTGVDPDTLEKPETVPILPTIE